MKRSLVPLAMAAGLAAVGLTGAAHAQNFPDRAVTLMHGSEPGGAHDFVARLLAAVLEKKWGQPVVVRNQSGASATIAAQAVARAAPDGYTLDLINNNHTLAPSLMDLAYDPVADFTPITRIGLGTQVLVVNKELIPAQTLEELIEYIRARPNELNFSSSGPGTATYLNMRALMNETGIEMTNVSYRGGGPSLAAILSGEVELGFTSVGSAVEHTGFEGARLTALAVSAKAGSIALPELPSVAEAANLPDYDYGSWYGLVAPAGLSPALLDQIYSDVLEVLEDPEVIEAFNARDIVRATLTPDEFRQFLVTEIETWAQWVTPEEAPAN